MPKETKIKNSDLLTAGSKAYAKKRKRKQQTVEFVEYNPDARRDYLTGFHKRKQARKKEAQKKKEERLRQERIKERAEIRAERKREIEERMAQMKAMYQHESEDDDSGDDSNNVSDGTKEDQDDSKKSGPSVKKFKSATALTTVTVIENMDDWGTQDN
ncbi:hypothetical protein VTP01DRAFT_9079 [Rhizomucor pusillus]|uniref:uncharacterized protein n=1 Tax=Rhizomucor pusillus TaxID=4840 RepID=UPI0037445F3F